MSDRARRTAERASARGRRLLARGRYLPARREFGRALAAAEEYLSAGSIELVPYLNDLGMAGKYDGSFEEARVAYGRALAIVNASTGDLGDTRATLLHNLAGLEHARGDATAAEKFARQGVAERRQLDDGRPLDLTSDLAALAAILVDLGRYGEARSTLNEVLERWRLELGPNHVEVASTLHNLGSLLFRTGDIVASARHLAEAVRIKRIALGAHHPDVAISLHNLARAHVALGRLSHARRLFREAIGLLADVTEDHPTLVSCREHLNALDY